MNAAMLHEARLLAARYLIARWAIAGTESVRLDSGAEGAPRPRPEPLPPQHATRAVWSIDHADVPALLVATHLAGTRHEGWARAVRLAERELTGGAP